VCPKESAQQIPTLGFLCIFLLDILLNVIVTGLLNRCFSAIRTRLFQLLLRYFEEKEEADIVLKITFLGTFFHLLLKFISWADISGDWQAGKKIER
jgi:hypothetical protein